MKKSNQRPQVEVTNGTADMLHAYQELRQTINRTILTVRTHYGGGTEEEKDLLSELKDASEELMGAMRNCLMENIFTEIQSGENRL